MNNKKTLFITQAAVIAALYVVLTHVANMLGLANYAVQVRFSEALTILPFFTPAAIPGLFIGCIIANITTGCMLLDIIFGSIATLLGALGTYLIAHGLKKVSDPDFYCKNNLRTWLTPIPPIVANTIIVPLVLIHVYHFEGTLPYFMATVFAGELISCFVLGMILLFALDKRKGAIFRNS
ncbi:MAG: QueT transporter family protein [Butyrivibrio sp.]|nr:QueT transporter family protein [Butyrivibrio sp.]